MIFFKNYAELYLKCDKRITSKRFYEISEESALFGSKKRVLFSLYFYHKIRFYKLLKEYLKNNFITLEQYYISLLFRFLLITKKFLKEFLFKKEFRFVKITSNDYQSQTLTFTAGVERLYPRIDKLIIENIQSKNEIIRISLAMRVYCAVECIKVNMFDFERMLQYKILKNDLDKISWENKSIIIEEGRNRAQMCLMDYAKINHIELTIVFRGVPYLPRHYFGFDVIVTNNIAYDVYKKYNKNVKIGLRPYVIDYSKIIEKKCKIDKIGFLPDIGNAVINYADKKVIDQFVNKFSIENKINIIVSTHPQEKELNIDYYNKAFNSPYVTFREEDSFEDYLNSIDILIGGSSTSMYQSFLAKTPVILLDLFNDKPMERFAELSNGLVRSAKDQISLMTQIHELNSLSIPDINFLHNKALNNLEILSN